MLKALELAGFKSFADRTRFDFPDGITVVVGPNGSGKSNIVDAIKWVLGSQSAKSLRGKEMSDVIFKGSQTRAAAGAAEATIVFENSDGNLPVDAPEVHVTRRVYRSGESEYLINQQAVRLKDVKDLIRGTGIGIDAYSLIEQGKVDRMLQANAKDRRAIFEEAAGISRFKAKKIEAERRLARVQSNLTRLSDIVDEVNTRLRSVRSQASKAERYRQASERLKELRTVVAWNDWANLNEELTHCETELAEAVATQQRLEAERNAMTEKRKAAEEEQQQIANEIRELETTRRELLSQSATLTGRRDADQNTIREVRSTIAAALWNVRGIKRESQAGEETLANAISDSETSAAELENVRRRASEVQSKRDQIQSETNEVLKRRDQVQKDHVQGIRELSQLDSDRQQAQSQLKEAERAASSLQTRLEQANEQLSQATQSANSKESEVELLRSQINDAEAAVSAAEKQAVNNRAELDRRSGETAELRATLEGVRQRYLVLEDLQERGEGVAGGVREVIGQLSIDELADADGVAHDAVASYVGMVADLVSADVDVAPMIDAALGEKSQHLVANSPALAKAILAGEINPGGRVGILRMDGLPDPPGENPIQLEGLQGVVGRADLMVECAPEHRPLIAHLLSSTWVVETLETAEKIRKLGGDDQRSVTLRGEVLETDGALLIGPTGSTTGLVSRRSELNAAAEEIERYTFQVSENDEAIAQLAREVDQQSIEHGKLQIAHRNLLSELAAAESDLRHATERQTSSEQKRDQLAGEQEQTQDTIVQATATLKALSEQTLSKRQTLEQLEAESADIEETLSETQQALQSAGEEVTTVSVELARAEENHQATLKEIEQQRAAQTTRESAWSSAKQSSETGYSRLAELNERLVTTLHDLEQADAEAQTLDSKLKEWMTAADQVREQSRAIAQATEAVIQNASSASESVHAISNRRDAAKLRRSGLAERIAEDYQIDLEHDEPPEELAEIEDRKSVDSEITRLREQLQRTSNVNMEALAELEGLQERYDHLSGQYEDLSAAKESLQRIIGRINADSRRLFLDTLEAIRQNFQKLYRKSFGGGHADLVLEESEDPLEAGVEIVATPPGKPSFSNSLLSGGEKALTAVALLMAIFQYRPSPFCVLDEVDAPFDEANIGRFVMVLNEFLDHSKFVIVTHSKKTMTAATTLYGVTMQESGVSKRVSIRFEDVSDDGEINEGEAA
ncbi:MAG: chromosome segregation protein SMC [Planctomycetota bacterium]